MKGFTLGGALGFLLIWGKLKGVTVIIWPVHCFIG